MAEITAANVAKLREMTNAGMMDCKRALTDAQGDMEKAVEILRKKGAATAATKAAREAREGIVVQSVLPGARAGILVEVNCETDFVARTEGFVRLAHELAMQVAAANPRYLTKEEVPAAVLEEERAVYRSQIEGNKPPQVVERIVEGKLGKFYEENCLLEQPYIRAAERKVKDLVTEMVAQVGENIVVRRFVRYELGA
jgi:elongation factor Ts